MRPKDDLVYLGHMLDTTRKIAAKVEGLTREAFDADEDLRLALVHLVQVVGEAARRVSEERKQLAPGIPWREVIGMRHKLVHDYMDVSFDLLWTVVTLDIDPLLRELEQLVPANEED